MSRIFVTGDTHGMGDSGKIERLVNREKLSYDDYVIICGDAGIVYNDATDYFINSYEKFGVTILYVDGNHENFNMLENMPILHWKGGKVHKISEHIYHLMRGQVYNIDNRKIFVLGGAESTDIDKRTENKNWWRAESINLLDSIEATKNLKKVNNKVDYIVTHAPPKFVISEINKIVTQCGEHVPYFLEKKLKQELSPIMIEAIINDVEYKRIFSGHLHIDEIQEKWAVLYQEVVEI